MIKARMSDLAKALDAKLIGDDVEVTQIYTDSRQIREQGLFVALKGPHFDAHDFISQVVNQGAVGVVVEKPCEESIPQLVVENCKKALGNLARFNRERLDARFIALTGSSGKTTVKEMVASILQTIGSTLATKGNLNNDIGAPLTLLEMNEQHQFGVIELGANHAGEIAYTAAIVRPDVALINNVAAAHLEGFGDLQGVARAKGEIFSELEEEGVAVINVDDEFADYWLHHIHSHAITFGINNEADVSAKNIVLNDEQCATFELVYEAESATISLALPGYHNVYNALAAASCCLALGIGLDKIVKGLSLSPAVSGRLMTEFLSNGCRVIDDTYNANLASVKAAIRLLSGFNGKRILVLGDMGELGESGRLYHQQVGEYAAQYKIDALYSCGVLTQFTQQAFAGEGQHFSHQQALIQVIKNEAKIDTTILVKGSRSAHMEKVVLALTEEALPESSNIASTEGEE